jgi:hypothetical protein
LTADYADDTAIGSGRQKQKERKVAKALAGSGARRISVFFVAFWCRENAGGTPATTALFQRYGLFFLAEFLEARIVAQRIPERIEPKKGRRNRRWVVKPSIIARL